MPATVGMRGQLSKRAWTEMAKQPGDILPSLPSQVHQHDPFGSDDFVRAAVEGKPVDIEEGL